LLINGLRTPQFQPASSTLNLTVILLQDARVTNFPGSGSPFLDDAANAKDFSDLFEPGVIPGEP